MSWGTALKTAEILLGLTLLYLRFCLYETEEGRLQNTLVALWVRVSGYADSTRARFERLLRETAQITTRFLDGIFGNRSVSLRAISVSYLLILASGDFSVYGEILAGVPAEEIKPFPGTPPWLAPWLLLGRGILLLLAAFAPLFIPRRWAIRIPIITFFLMFGLFVIGLVSNVFVLPYVQDRATLIFILTTTVTFALIVDFLWLIAVRLGTKWASMHRTIWPHAVVILTSATIAVGSFLLLPFSNWFVAWAIRAFPALPRPILAVILGVSASRLFVAAISIIQLTVLLIAFVHWIIWPVLSRLVYSAERYQLFRERKFFGTIGVVLMTHASAGTSLANLWLK